ncbi:MAG TPA: hypothetical protein DD457_09690 [Gammaproteobacteria bacterium]|nr:hypothetical protein [Gammaproteobacteria bacterium]HCP49821.1 hypothetical protein [Gammaproteobacteria bacterium]|tara:strand:- start:2398 stop:2817 length:420 start_codon:yes stop_codon:yes gene_type:complete
MNILSPVLGMMVLTLAMTIALFVSRLPIIVKNFPNLQGAKYADDMKQNMSAGLRNITDNYNHLFEQPVLFYATALYIHLVGHVDLIHIRCAWVFVGFRVAHSLVQATINNVATRLTMFLGATVALAIMVVREMIVALAG